MKTMNRQKQLAGTLEKQEKWRRIVTYFSDRRPELCVL